MSACHLEVFVDQKRGLSSAKESVLLLSIVLRTLDFLSECRILDDLLQSGSDLRVKYVEVREYATKKGPRRLKIVNWSGHLEVSNPNALLGRDNWNQHTLLLEAWIPILEWRRCREFSKSNSEILFIDCSNFAILWVSSFLIRRKLHSPQCSDQNSDARRNPLRRLRKRKTSEEVVCCKREATWPKNSSNKSQQRLGSLCRQEFLLPRAREAKLQR